MAVSKSGRCFAIYAAKDEMELVDLAVEDTCFVGQSRLRGRDHPKKEFGLLRFLFASADYIAKVFLREAFICFAVICTDACPAADKLVDQPVVVRAARNLFQETDDIFSKNRGSLLKVERMARRDTAIIFDAPAAPICFGICSATSSGHCDRMIGASLELGGWSLGLHSRDSASDCFTNSSPLHSPSLLTTLPAAATFCAALRSAWRFTRSA